MIKFLFFILFVTIFLISDIFADDATNEPRIKISPDLLFYTNQEIFSTSTLPFLINNLGNDILIVDNIKISPAYRLQQTNFPIEISPNKPVRLHVDFNPTTLGNHTGYLLVHSNDPTNPVVRYTLFGVGVEQNAVGGGCLIATAVFGSEMANEVQMLREIRDHSLLATQSGTAFMVGFNQFYYLFSPTISDWERQNPIFKEVVKITITPLLNSLAILNYVDIDSEYEMLGYGISVIAMNIGMYLAAPAIVIHKVVRKYTAVS